MRNDEIFELAKRLARQMQFEQRKADIKFLESYVWIGAPGYLKLAQERLVNALKKQPLLKLIKE